METLKTLRDYLNSDIPINEYPCFESIGRYITGNAHKHYFVAEKPVGSGKEAQFRVFPCADGGGQGKIEQSVGLPVWQHLDDAVSAEFAERTPAIPSVS
jgi:hypothetical protein